MNLLFIIINKFNIRNHVQTIGKKIYVKSPYAYKCFFLPIKCMFKKLFLKCISSKSMCQGNVFFWPLKKNTTINEALVSVIVPNYNHAMYLEKRLESIYLQSYKNIEVILLDDCSSDNSLEILQKYHDMYPKITKLVTNTVNSKSVFNQWRRGISMARGEYIWIAESDDWCDHDFIEKMLQGLQNDMVMLAFAKSKFMKNGICINETEKYLSDCKEFNWGKNFWASAHELVNYAFARKNIIPNVSSMIFKNHPDIINNDMVVAWDNLRLCGDWYFYLNIIRGGLVYYSSETTNYYRIHEKSTSLKIQSSPIFYMEYEYISSYIARNYNVDMRVFDEVYKDLVLHWKYYNNSNADIKVSKLYRLDKIALEKSKRKPNIAMCCFSFIMGGGETYPIFLANQMRKMGITVTLVNFNLGGNNQDVKNIISKSLPILNLSDINYNSVFIKSLGLDIIHSHHAVVDEMNAVYVQNTQCKLFVTLHGMYESIREDDSKRVMNLLKNVDAVMIYTAKKNINLFQKNGIFKVKDFIKLDNGLPDYSIKPICRENLDITKDAFVFCLVSRGIPEKGWSEAVEAINIVRNKIKRDIQIIIIGDGVMYDAIKARNYKFVHLLGEKQNIRDYYAMCDMGILPTYFPGESYPLVIIDCLKAGIPMLTSNIGEISHQLSTPSGKYAGLMVELRDGKIHLEDLVKAIERVVENKDIYISLCNNVVEAREKFDISNIAQQYIDLYKNNVNIHVGNSVNKDVC